MGLDHLWYLSINLFGNYKYFGEFWCVISSVISSLIILKTLRSIYEYLKINFFVSQGYCIRRMFHRLGNHYNINQVLMLVSTTGTYKIIHEVIPIIIVKLRYCKTYSKLFPRLFLIVPPSTLPCKIHYNINYDRHYFVMFITIILIIINHLISCNSY